MNQFRTCLAVLGTLIATMGQAQITNGGFESAGSLENQAASWFHFGNAYREDDFANSGGFSMKQFGNFSGSFNVSGAFQNFAIAPGQAANVTGFGYNASADAMSGGNWAILKLIYRDATDQDLVAVESGRIDASTIQDQWLSLSAALGPAPSNTHHGAIFILFLQPEFAGGAAWFDDVVVSVFPQTVVPSAIETTEGSELMGDLLSVATSDDDRYCSFNDEASLRCTIVATGQTTATTVSELKVKVELNAARLGLAYGISMLNVNTNAYVFVGGGTATATDQTQEIILTSTAPNFVSATGQIRTRVTWNPVNDEDPSQDGWLHCLDLVQWTVTP